MVTFGIDEHGYTPGGGPGQPAPSPITLDNYRRDDLAASGRPGIGTVAIIRRWNSIDPVTTLASAAGWTASDAIQMWGVRSIRGPQIATNNASGAHLNMLDGFASAFPGSRDAGTFEFEANWNPPSLEWQQEAIDPGGGFYSSLFDSPIVTSEDETRGPMRALLIQPASMPHAWVMGGYCSMLGPINYEMDDIVRVALSFKISGRPVLYTGHIIPGLEAIHS